MVAKGASVARRSATVAVVVAVQSGVGALDPQGNSTFVFLADTHLGEGCASAPTGYEANDTDCYSVIDLRRTVARINGLQPPPAFVIVGGDVTASAQETEFAAVKTLLDTLAMPYIPVMGNHDVWSYDQARLRLPARCLFCLRACLLCHASQTRPGRCPFGGPTLRASRSRPHTRL
jgi:hypothetical protein